MMWLALLLAQSPAFFEPPPPADRLHVRAVRRATPPVLDGKLDDWPPVPTLDGGFVQFEPQQGSPATRHTTVWLAFDDSALYIAARLTQPEPLNQRDLRRDFMWSDSDSFGVFIDPVGDGRLCNSFQVNPFGAQRDMQVIEDELFEVNWDTVWRSATSRDADGWTVEIALPFRSFRYGPPPWGLQLVRRQRSSNEDSLLTPIPRSVTPWRMTYAAVFDGLEVPPPSGAPQLRPYVTVRADKTGDAPIQVLPSAGGEVTWAPTADTVVDLTGNTDFAETDVDRRVVNLSRFSVLFPERRQFFLESAGVFTIAGNSQLQPFFSRRVGLSGGNPTLVYGGARVVHRSTQRSAGALVVATGPNATAPASVVGVARWAENSGEANRVGGLLAVRHDFRSATGALESDNIVPAVDALVRAGNFTFSGAVLGSLTREVFYRRPAQESLGGAAVLKGTFQSNVFTLEARAYGLTPRFEARTGFLSRANVFGIDIEGGFDLRPAWLPRFLRNTGPWFDGYILYSSSRLTFQEAGLTLAPVWVQFSGGDEAWLFVDGSAQVLDEAFSPVAALPVGVGQYLNGRVGAAYFGQTSRKVSVGFDVSIGRFYGFDELRLMANASVQPVPFVQVAARYGFNRYWGESLGVRGVETHLLLLETRLALSPKLQLVGSFQRDSEGNRLVTNARIAWEYLPLSFIYLVLTDTRAAFPAPDAVMPDTRVVLKATYTWQP